MTENKRTEAKLPVLYKWQLCGLAAATFDTEGPPMNYWVAQSRTSLVWPSSFRNAARLSLDVTQEALRQLISWENQMETTSKWQFFLILLFTEEHTPLEMFSLTKAIKAAVLEVLARKQSPSERIQLQSSLSSLFDIC